MATVFTRILVLVSVLGWTCVAKAELEAAEQAESKARNAYIDRFIKFTQDKNVMGKSSSPDGKAAKGGRKTRFDRDGGGLLPFQSDLTYHELTFFTLEEEKGPDPNKPGKVSILREFVSDHGKLTGAGGSSVLERTVYGLHKQFTKEEEDPKNPGKDDAKKGISYRSVFKISTQEVFNDDKGGGQQGGQQGGDQANNKKGEPDKVERQELREEARPDVDKVGENSFDTINRAAKDEGFEDDAKTLPNMTFLYEAAGRATQAMWNSSLQNLTQRRANRNVPVAGGTERVQLSEGAPDCDSAIRLAMQKTLAPIQDKNARKGIEEQYQKQLQQCRQMVAMPFNVIDPRFVTDEKNPKAGEQLKVQGPQKEDGIQRDLRVQMELMAKAGRKAGSVQANWKYEAKDEQAKLTQYDENGRAIGDRFVTPREQIESYNAQLQDAAKGMEEIRSRFPDYRPDTGATLGYQIAPETRSIMDINKAPQAAMEEFGPGAIGAQQQQPPPPQTYDQLLQRQ